VKKGSQKSIRSFFKKKTNTKNWQSSKCTTFSFLKLFWLNPK
jgi:hypothetical protein